MRHKNRVILTQCVFLFCFWLLLGGRVGANLGLKDVRIARADVDGDGVFEILAGGRLGPALAFDVPRSARQAGVGVYVMDGDFLRPVCERGDLQVVADVAGGDVDGDGVDEVVVVGMGVLRVFDVVQRQLVEAGRVTLPNEWTDRVMVADVDDDGHFEVGVTVYDIGANAEMGRSEVIFWQWSGQTLQQKMVFNLDGHVGDLCAVRSVNGQSFVVLEVGAGDEGGELQVVSPRDGRTIWQGRVTPEQMRALHLDGQANRLAIGGVDGRVVMAQVMANGLVRQDVFQRTAQFSGFVWMPDMLVVLSQEWIVHRLQF